MSIKNILVIRNDRLGDFMLAWPALQLIKKQYPHARITALVPAYTQPVAELCPWIDNILIDNNRENSYSGGLELYRIIKPEKFDAVITLFSEFRTGLAVWLCRIPTRVAPASKIAQIFYNHRLVQRRSRSEKPEFEYNLDLARYFIELQGDTCFFTPQPPYLVFDHDEIIGIKQQYLSRHTVNRNHKIIIVHAGSGGSANNLSLQQYADLISQLAQSPDRHFILTAGPGETEIADRLSEKITGIDHSVYHSTQGLVQFCKFIDICDLFISGSTGPLHIAGALNKSTAAFYPARRSATSLRWRTLNDEEKQVAFIPDSGNGDTDMASLNITAAAHAISSKFLSTPNKHKERPLPGYHCE